MTANQWKFGAAAAVAVAIFAAIQSGSAQPTPAGKGDAKEAGEGDAQRAADEKAIRASAAKFVKAFNAADAKGASEQFLPNAEYQNSDGEAFVGRAAIEKDLTAYFKEFPKAKIELVIDSIRFVGPRVAIEEGRTSVTHSPESAPVVQSYLSVDVLVEGEWKLGSVRELAEEVEEAPLTHHDRLEPLAWLVGDWIDESADGIAETSCRWTDDGNYLIQDFRLKVAGMDVVSGQQRIGWDPLTQQVKSWVFDSQGGYSEGLWTWHDDRWIVKSSGVKTDGRTASATNYFTPRTDSYIFESTARITGGELQPDVRVVVVRRPPAAGAKAEKGSATSTKSK